MLDCLKQGAFDQIVAREQRCFIQRPTLCLGHSDAQKLSRIVPFVQSFRCVYTFEALQTNQRSVEHLSQGLRSLRLADARLALQEQWLREPHRAKERGGQPFVREVPDIT